MVEFLSDKQIREKIRDEETYKNVYHICSLYVKGEPLKVKVQDGRVVEFTTARCKLCKRKVLVTKRRKDLIGDKVCVKCAVERLDKIKDDMDVIIDKEDKKLYEMAEAVAIKEELERRKRTAM